MIVICSGLPKSATTITFAYTEELLMIVVPRNGRKQFRFFYREGFVHRFGFINTTLFLFLHLFFGSIVIKTHAAPTFFVRLLIRLGIAKAMYNIRDPRDIALSAIDHGKRNSSSAFAKYKKPADMFGDLRKEGENYLQWKAFGRVLFIRYEVISAAPLQGLEQINNYLRLQVPQQQLAAVSAYFEANKATNRNFNKGTSGRYLQEMSPAEQLESAAALKTYIHELGYNV